MLVVTWVIFHLAHGAFISIMQGKMLTEKNIAYNDDKQHRCYLLIAAVLPAPPARLIIYHLVIATRLIVMDSCSNGPIIVPFVILRAGRPLYRDLSGLICHHLVLIIR